MGIINFFIDILETVVDIWNTWRQKDEIISGKLIRTIITLVFLIISAKICL
ncbi:MAG: hypothetical protein E7D69_16035 [Clostridium celatum]|nr:hypothetical protein [Clostridium celatum]MDU4326367.1 hypothetical protein [Clostridium celatum]